MSYEHIRVETRGAVGLVTLDRPEAMNALCDGLLREVSAAVRAFAADDGVGAVVLTGGDEVFAAGADIKEMQGRPYVDLFLGDFPNSHQEVWVTLEQCRKPVIAAVAGYALGGGCELAMACDFILAAETAKFGQPEVKIGALPGAGGTQRLTRLVGKSKAMEMCLTGRLMDAAEAERVGLVSRVLPVERLLEEALAVAGRIAELSRPAVFMAKEAVKVADETTLQEGLRFERRLFEAAFATADCAEGMAAFAGKRKPAFRNR